MRFTDKCYKLKEDETEKDWLRAFCDKLNDETEGVTYWFREWDYGCAIEARPQGKRYQISIEWKPPRWRNSGNIATVNVRSDEIYPAHPRINRPFKVSFDGSVNIAGVHRCVTKRLAEIEEYIANRKARAESYSARKKLLKDALKGSGVKAEHYSDNSGLSLKKKDQDFSATLGMNNVAIGVTTLHIPFDRIPAFFEAWAKLEEAIKGDDDDD